MRNILRTRINVVQGSMIVVLLAFTPFVMTTGLTAFAHDRDTHSHTVPPMATPPPDAPSGTANLKWDPQSKALTVTLHLQGLEPGSDHASHIHAGTCATLGKILHPLNNIVADTAGNGTSTTTVDNVPDGIPVSGWHVEVHRGPTAKTKPLLCGDVANTKKATSLTVPFMLAPSGIADLQWDAQRKMLTATLHLQGLEPGSDHAAGIYAGTCAKKGNSLYPLKNVVADTARDGTSTTTIDNIPDGIPASGWYIEVYSGTTAQTDSLLCGDIANTKMATSVTIPLE